MTEQFSYESVTLDPVAHTVAVDGAEVPFTVKEYKILECLLRRPHAAVTRQELIDWAWGQGSSTRSNTLDVHIKNIRRKITTESGRPRIQVLRGVGYRLM